MSVWTHVSGSLRLDSIPGMGPPIDLHEVLGFTCTFDDNPNAWDACTVPCGSEGSLQFGTVPGVVPSSLNSHNVIIWGDLRDYENPDSVVEWFEERLSVLSDYRCRHRGATLLAQTEGDNGWWLYQSASEEPVHKMCLAKVPGRTQPFPQTCPDCDSSQIRARLEHETFQYGSLADDVNLAVEVMVYTCAACKFQWTDYMAEAARDAAVRAYRESLNVGARDTSNSHD